MFDGGCAAVQYAFCPSDENPPHRNGIQSARTGGLMEPVPNTIIAATSGQAGARSKPRGGRSS